MELSAEEEARIFKRLPPVLTTPACLPLSAWTGTGRIRLRMIMDDRMMERIEEFELTEALKAFDGVVVGYSAGAVIQLGEYHLYPDGDYPDYAYYRGLGYVDGLYVEVHYEYKPEQDESVRRVLSERDLPVYVTHTRKGGIVVENGNVKIIGKVNLYQK